MTVLFNFLEIRMDTESGTLALGANLVHKLQCYLKLLLKLHLQREERGD